MSSGGPAATEGVRPGGLVLGRYRLEERLGAGGFGVVWRARDERLEREVAVKALARADTDADTGSGRPAREGRAAARLNHPGIVALYEMGADADSVYLVSELVRGRTFAELGREQALSDRDIARIGVALADALGHAHERGVIHRDVKPQNVIVVAEPAAGAGFAKLADFGVAHLVGDDPLTRTGDVVGTLAYMAPEQAEGLTPTGACDVYALALTLYEGLAGENPMRGRTPAETARLVGRPPPFLRDYRRDLPSGLCRALDACLDPRPEDRPALAEVRGSLDTSLPELDTSGGLVEPKTLARVGLPRREEWREAPTHAEPATAATAPVAAPVPYPAPAPYPAPPAAPPGAPAEGLPGEARPPLLASLPRRGVAGVAAGALAFAALALPTAEPPVAPFTVAAVVAVLCALLPRVGWLVAAPVVLAWLALGAGLGGAALLIALALAPTPLLLPRAGATWSLPGFAPLLGVIALAPAFVGAAGLASTVARRAGLGAAGFLWLAAAEAVTGDALMFGAPDAVPAPWTWESSVPAAATSAVPPYVSTLALVPALVWAVFAALLPLAVRGRALGPDLARGAVWAIALVAALAGIGDALAAADAGSESRGAVLGPLVAVVVALAVTTLRPVPGRRSAEAPEHLPGGAAGAPRGG